MHCFYPSLIFNLSMIGILTDITTGRFILDFITIRLNNVSHYNEKTFSSIEINLRLYCGVGYKNKDF